MWKLCSCSCKSYKNNLARRRQCCPFLLLHYGLSWQKGTWSWQTHFQETPSSDGASSVGGKRADCNANFPATINLQYGIRALSPRGCALLLYSISQLLPAITVNPHCPPHTKPLLHYIYQALYKRPKHMTAALWAVLPPGLGGPLPKEGTFSWPTVHLFPGLGTSDTMRAADFLLYHIPATSYINPRYEMCTDVFKTPLKTAFGCEQRCQMYVSGACGMSLITWMFTSNCATSSHRCSALCPFSTSSYESLRLFTSLSAE